MVTNPHRHGGFAQARITLQGFRRLRRVLLQPLLQLEAGGAGWICPSHEGAKRIHPFRALKRRSKRARFTQDQGQAGGGLERRPILEEQGGSLQNPDDVRIRGRRGKNQARRQAVGSSHRKVGKVMTLRVRTAGEATGQGKDRPWPEPGRWGVTRPERATVAAGRLPYSATDRIGKPSFLGGSDHRLAGAGSDATRPAALALAAWRGAG